MPTPIRRPFVAVATSLTLALGLVACGSGSTTAEDLAKDSCELLRDTDFEALFADALAAEFGERSSMPVGPLATFEKNSAALEEKAEESGISEDEVTEAMEEECPGTLAEWEEWGSDLGEDSDDETAAPDIKDEGSGDGGPATLPDTPFAYSNLLVVGDRSLLPLGPDGEVGLAAVGTIGKDDTSFPVLVHNRTDEPISNIEVTGRARTTDGETVGSGSSQGFEPNVVLPGEYAVGYVYIDQPDLYLPKGAVLEDVSVDHTAGLGDYENSIAVDVEDFEQLRSGAFSGDVVNPHDVAVSGPISVAALCVGADGSLTHTSDYADKEDLEPGERSTFTVNHYEGKLSCDVVLVGASGYDG